MRALTFLEALSSYGIGIQAANELEYRLPTNTLL